ncbi:MAG: bifunctional oligoribonuclease/PAP phosphatase NrnA [Anaerolineae bacterium]
MMNWSEFGALLDGANRILLVTHIKPDGDAIGSLVALANMLRSRGKAPIPVVDGGMPEFLKFIPGSEQVVGQVPALEYEVMVSLDASDEERTGEAGKEGRGRSWKVLNVDHHPTNTGFGDMQLVDPVAVSTTEVLWDGFSALDWTIPESVAVPLLVGLVTDTIGFRTSNVTPHTLSIASSLTETGVSLYEIIQKTLITMPFSTVQMWRSALETVELKDRVISATLTLEGLRKAGLNQPSDSGGLIGFLMSVNEARVAAVFKEVTAASIEISLRSKPGYDVSGVAFELGGGGHKQASGATMTGTMDEVQQRVLPMLRRIARHKSSST